MSKRKKPMGEMTKDIGKFTLGSTIIGVGAVGIAKMGVPAGVHASAGLGTLASGMGAVAPLIPMKASIGMMGQAMRSLPKQKRRRR